MSIDPKAANFYSGAPIDNCIGVYTGQITVPHRESPPNTITINTGFSNNPLFLGLIQAFPFDIYIPISQRYVTEGAWEGNPSKRGVLCRAQSGNLHLQTVTNSVSPIDFRYYLFAFAQKNQGVVSLNPPTPPSMQNRYLYYATNYRKIAFDEVLSFTTGINSISTFSFTHNLGFVPRAICFIEHNNSLMDVTNWDSSRTGGTSGTTVFTIIKTSTQFRVEFLDTSGSSRNLRVHLRIYYD